MKSRVKSKVIKLIPYGCFKIILRLKEKIELVRYYFGDASKYHIFLKSKAKKGGYKYGESSNDINVRWGEAFCDYNSGKKDKVINLMWTEDPSPGNYGDWLSPYIISKIGDVDVKHVSGINNTKEKHLIALGSVIDCANDKSIVISAGISDKYAKLNKDATYISVRGKYTANLLEEQEGISLKLFGDIGFLISKVYKPKIKKNRNKILLVRHARQSFFDIDIPFEYKEYSIFSAKPEDLELFIDEIYNSELVVTSAMHCFITCVSYGIPCKLVTFGNDDIKVPGDGVKFLDSLSGVELPELSPTKIHISKNMFEDIKEVPTYRNTIKEENLKDIEESIRLAIKLSPNCK
ncbi:polysaccharide pyruvyl transferase family protein [Vibrio splendidus]